MAPAGTHEREAAPVIIQKHVDEMADLLAPGMVSVVMLMMVKKVTTLEFRIVNIQSLKSGMHLLIFGQYTEHVREVTSDVANL